MNTLKYLKQTLEQLAETRITKIVSGNIPDIEVYRTVRGELTGLSLAIQEVEDLQAKNEEVD